MGEVGRRGGYEGSVYQTIKSALTPYLGSPHPPFSATQPPLAPTHPPIPHPTLPIIQPSHPTSTNLNNDIRPQTTPPSPKPTPPSPPPRPRHLREHPQDPTHSWGFCWAVCLPASPKVSCFMVDVEIEGCVDVNGGFSYRRLEGKVVIVTGTFHLCRPRRLDILYDSRLTTQEQARIRPSVLEEPAPTNSPTTAPAPSTSATSATNTSPCTNASSSPYIPHARSTRDASTPRMKQP